MEAFKKVVRLGKQAQVGNTFCEIKYLDGNLSICGVEGPLANGDARGACGQIEMHLKPSDFIEFAPGWTLEIVAEFLSVWGRWHLSDMKAGSAVQEAYLRTNPIPTEDYAYPKSHYDVASAVLKSAGINPDATGYKYGSAWVREEVPEEVLKFLAALPDTDMKPAWV